MTSPNVVEIRVVARDQTAAGFNAAAQGASKLAKSVDGGAGSAGGALESAEKKARGLGTVLGNVGTIAGGILAADVIREGAQRVMALSQQTIHAASSLGESLNAVDKTFGESSDTIHAWAQNNAASFGLSERAFNEAATPLGAMLKNQGLSMAEVEKHTISLTERAADMASVFNVNVSDALTAIQAGLRGESDPLERFGVSLSAVAVETRALADSGKTSAMQLTAQEKALARLNLIYDQTKSTAGDFKDTSDGLANAQRISTAEIENAQAKIGATFLPVMAKAAQVSGQFAEAVTSVPGPVAAAGAAVAIASAGLLLFAPRIMATKEALEQMTQSSSRVTRTAGNVAIGVGKLAAGFAAAQVAGQALSMAMHTDLNPQLEAVTQQLRETVKMQNLSGEAARLFGADVKELDGALSYASATGFAKALNKIDETSTSLLGLGDLYDTGADRVHVFDQALAQMVRDNQADRALALLADTAKRTGISIDELRKILPEYAGATEVATKGTRGVAAAAVEAAKSLDELEKQFDETFKKIFGYEEAQDAATDATERLNEQIKKQKDDGVEGAGSLEGNSKAARDNRDAVRDLVHRYEELMVQAQKTGQSTDGLREELYNTLLQMGFSEAGARRYADSLGDLKNALDLIQSKEITLTVRAGSQTMAYLAGSENPFLKGYAHGGVVGAATGGVRSNRVLTGEHGPELLDLPPGTQVHSNPDTERMLAAGGASEVRHIVELRLNGRTIRQIAIDEARSRNVQSTDINLAYP